MTIPAATSTGASGSRPGRGFIITSVILLAIATIAYTVAMAIFLPQLDVPGFEREIVTLGPESSAIPGEIQFRVLEPLAGKEVEVDVGVGLDSQGSQTCTVIDASGDASPMTPSGGFDLFVDPDLDSDDPDLVARNLGAGDYRVECDSDEADPGSFFVARSVSASELLGFAGPVVAVILATLASGVVFIVGVVLLIVGLVKRSRSKRPPMVGGGPVYPQPVTSVQPTIERPPDQSHWQPPPGRH